MDNQRNIVKPGNVIPVRVSLTSQCTGAAVTTPTLFIQLYKGNVFQETIDGTIVVTESVSNADTGQQLRVSGSGYIYNLSTKSLNTNQDYTIQITSGSLSGPVILSAVIQPKK